MTPVLIKCVKFLLTLSVIEAWIGDRPELFRCNNGNLIRLNKVCDRVYDCLDQSDQKYCNYARCRGSQFDCGNQNYDCVPFSARCNGVNDCSNGRDEQDCAVVSVPSTCDDFCMSSCSNTVNGEEICFCPVDDTPANNPLCSAILFTSWKDTIKIKHLSNSGIEARVEIPEEVMVIAGTAEHIYWVAKSKNNSQVIMKSLHDGSEQNLFLTSGLVNVSDIDIDYITGNIYFTDFNLGFIGACSQRKGACTTLHEQQIDQPTTLALAPNYGLIFWATSGDKAHIGRSSMSGSYLKRIVETDKFFVKSLTISEQDRRLYYLDSADRIRSISFNDEYKSALWEFSTPVPQTFTISAIGKNLFTANIQNISVSSSSYNYNATLYKAPDDKAAGDFFVYDAFQELTAENPCSGQPCGTGICLLASTPPYSTKNTLSYMCKCKTKEEQSEPSCFGKFTATSTSCLPGSSH